MRPYPQYKDSGEEWIGKIPVHWEQIRLKYAFELIREKNFDDSATKVGLENIQSWTGNYLGTDSEFSGDGIAFQINDLLFGKLRPYLAKVLLADFDGSAVGDIFVYRPTEKIHPRFAFYRMLSKEFINTVDGSTFGAKMPRASSDFIGNLIFPLPQRKEQEAIAAYLDDKTAVLDTLITQKQRLIELLQEERTAVISTAVTQGLNPNAPRKPSSIDWLGDIPIHWDIAAIKHIVETPVTDGPHETPEFVNDGIPFISAEAIKNNQIDFSKKRGYISQEVHEKYSKKYKPQKDDIYMVKSGATTGNVAKVETDEEFNIWSPLAAIRPDKDKALTNFIFYFMQSINFFQAIESGWSFGTQQNIGMGVIENIAVTLPPLIEQDRIAVHIENKVAQIGDTIAQTEKQIALLQEYRTTVISHAVTGKIDVRTEVYS